MEQMDAAAAAETATMRRNAALINCAWPSASQIAKARPVGMMVVAEVAETANGKVKFAPLTVHAANPSATIRSAEMMDVAGAAETARMEKHAVMKGLVKFPRACRTATEAPAVMTGAVAPVNAQLGRFVKTAFVKKRHYAMGSALPVNVASKSVAISVNVTRDSHAWKTNAKNARLIVRTKRVAMMDAAGRAASAMQAQPARTTNA